MLFSVKPWKIASLARRTSKRFSRWSRMRIFVWRESNPHWLDPLEPKICVCHHRPVTQAVLSPLSLLDLWVRFPFCLWYNHDQFVGGVIFHGMAWRLTLLLSEGNVCLCNDGCGFAYIRHGFAYIHGFFVRWKRILRTLCRFCVRIQISSSRCWSW